MQKADGKATDHQQSSIGLAERMLQRAIADMAPVEEQVLHSIVAATDRRIGYEAVQANLFMLALYRDEGVGDFVSEELGNAFHHIVRAGQIKQLARTALQGHVHLWIGQGNARKRLGNMAGFCLRGSQEFAAHGRVEE